MNWLFFALLSPAIFAINVLIDKYILEKEIKDYQSMPIYSSIMAFVFGVLLWFITGFPIISFQDTILVLLTGMLTLWGAAFYFKALADHESSKIMILFQTQPIITLILSYLFLNDTISPSQLLGFFIILVATIGVSLEKNKTKFKISSVFILILFANFFWAIASVVFKFVVNQSSFIKLVSYESLGMALGGLVLYSFFPSFKKAFKKTQKSLRKIILAVILTNEGLYSVGRFIAYLAISLGPVALVNVVGGTQVFYGILFGLILTQIAPKIFQENITKVDLTKKIILAILVFIGLYLVKG